jgi:ribosomal protein L40E
MPCYRCGVRQVDPARGHSPWQRGVRGDQQVLVCPDCQAVPGQAAELDHCRRCGSVRLVRRLGEVECRACGFVVPPEVSVVPPEVGVAPPEVGVAPAAPDAGAAGGDGGSAGMAGGTAPGLAEEVALALERVLGRNRVPPASATIR